MKLPKIKHIVEIELLWLVAFVFGLTFYTFYSLWPKVVAEPAPCQHPITYSIGTLDARFKLSRADFLKAIAQAESIWEKPLGQQLFTPADQGPLKINLLYDYRQAATTTLQKLGLTLTRDKASYTTLKTKYTALFATYTTQKANLDLMVSAFKAHQATYEAAVTYWNGRRGAPPEIYQQLQQDKASLDAEVTAINQAQASLNETVSTVNAMATTLNQMAGELNLNVGQYNTVGSSTGKEFEEGNFVEGPEGQVINIYQYTSKAKLIRVLAHELGHALGLQHLTNPKAIMYSLNQGTNQSLTADDVAALKTLCGVK